MHNFALHLRKCAPMCLLTTGRGQKKKTKPVDYSALHHVSREENVDSRLRPRCVDFTPRRGADAPYVCRVRIAQAGKNGSAGCVLIARLCSLVILYSPACCIRSKASTLGLSLVFRAKRRDRHQPGLWYWSSIVVQSSLRT